jgi:hypothetical protein
VDHNTFIGVGGTAKRRSEDDVVHVEEGGYHLFDRYREETAFLGQCTQDQGEQEHYIQRWKESERPPHIELANRDLPSRPMLLEKQRGDEEPGDNHEQVDPANERTCLGSEKVNRHDHTDCNCTNTVEWSDKSEFGRTRAVGLAEVSGLLGHQIRLGEIWRTRRETRSCHVHRPCWRADPVRLPGESIALTDRHPKVR